MVVAAAHELRVGGVVLRTRLAIDRIAPKDAVAGGRVIEEVVVVRPRRVVRDRAAVEGCVGDHGVVAVVLDDEVVHVQSAVDRAAIVGRRAVAPDDAAHGVRVVGAAAHPGDAVLDDAVEKRTARRAAAAVVDKGVNVAVAEREAGELRRLSEVGVSAQADVHAVVRAAAVDDRRGGAVHGADVERDVVRDRHAGIGAVGDADHGDRVVGVGEPRGFDRVDCCLDAGVGVGPAGAVLCAGAGGRHVERVRAERERRAEQSEECEEREEGGTVFHGGSL